MYLLLNVELSAISLCFVFRTLDSKNGQIKPDRIFEGALENYLAEEEPKGWKSKLPQALIYFQIVGNLQLLFIALYRHASEGADENTASVFKQAAQIRVF